MFDCWRKFDMGGQMAIVGGVLLHLTLGTLYCFGNMNTYMTSYLRAHVPSQAHQEYSDAIWIPTLSTIGQGLFMPLSGYLEERIGIRITILIGSAFMSSGVFLTYYSIQHSLGLTTLTYGFMFGFGTALAYAPPMGVAMRWFPRKKGLVNGVIVGGFGLGAFIFNQVQTTYLNPKNISLDKDGYFTDPEVLDRVPKVFLLLGSIYTIMQLVAVMLITVPNDDHMNSTAPLVTSAADEEEIVYQNDGLSESGSSLNLPQTARLEMQEDQDNIKPHLVIKSTEFWLLWLTFLFNQQSVGYINAMYKAFGQTFIDDDHFLAIVGAFAAIFNSTGRVFWGHLCDVFSYRMCMLLVTTLIAALYSTLYLTEHGGKAMFALWVWAIFFSFCGNFVLMPTASAQCFGTKYSSKNYGLVMTGSAAAAPVIAVLTQVLSPVVGYLGMFLIISCLSGVSCCLTLYFPTCPSPRKILSKLSERPTDI